MNVKVFPEYNSLDLNVKGDILSAFAFTPPPVADLAFNTLFGWQEYFGYRISRFENFLFAYCENPGKLSVLLPLETESLPEENWGKRFLGLANALSVYCKTKAAQLEFAGIPESFIKKLPKDSFSVSFERDSFDYVYKREALAELTGSGYSPKRNLIKQFEKKYKYSYEPLGNNNLAKCDAFIRSWEVTKENSDILGSGAYCMACRLMENFSSLELCGGIVKVEGRVVAATVASIVENFAYENGIYPTAVVHHENGLTDYKGVYQMINREFAKSLPKNVIYINREEDLGIAGLRKAKMSYVPELLIKKGTIRLL